MAKIKGDSGPFDRSPSHLMHRALQRALDIYAEACGPDAPTQRQYAVLASVSAREGLTQADLVKATGIDRSTLADLVARMMAKGLLARERSSEDGRANEGVGAGPASLRGTLLANEKGWRAPESGRSSQQGAGANTSRADTASAARDVQARGAASSGSDAPATPAGTADRAGTTSGKPPGEATTGENDPGTGTQKEV